jgi:hypothetical protein
MEWMPSVDTELLQWWYSLAYPPRARRDLWTAVILIFWCIWRYQNDVVFNDATSEARAIRGRINDEFHSWRLARLYRSKTFGFHEPFPFS